ncbi:uncharacterized protein BO97DRAFT_287742 [Aspergillus homomorphus CBS 101889]|uniref:Uncharacterized protein n=1 Tax=Aspergillus homomorphus (strain CBS 101889) TaxID=1450537 RepID=A0A395HFD6_ASPHC|nr:hypothetical protein BO97DRAFT_287742 [Aspergillus homomorphus CBS 101889]RAL06671.1 hypothetical protein BO97DRAFT_287742 [Aspergillus homomorphus CBS 101889]
MYTSCQTHPPSSNRAHPPLPLLLHRNRSEVSDVRTLPRGNNFQLFSSPERGSTFTRTLQPPSEQFSLCVWPGLAVIPNKQPLPRSSPQSAVARPPPPSSAIFSDKPPPSMQEVVGDVNACVASVIDLRPEEAKLWCGGLLTQDGMSRVQCRTLEMEDDR